MDATALHRAVDLAQARCGDAEATARLVNAVTVAEVTFHSTREEVRRRPDLAAQRERQVRAQDMG
jgi:hypothetical protein